jgi:hypothetical protein
MDEVNLGERLLAGDEFSLKAGFFDGSFAH